MKTTYFIVIFFNLVSCTQLYSDEKRIKGFPDKIQEIVLSENKIGQEYFFKVMLKKKVLEYRITYLGTIKTKQGDSLKFINSTTYSGLYEDSKRANCRVFIYDAENIKKGYYYVGGAWDSPSKIEGNNLIFSFNNERCNQTTSINFGDGIPKEFFINCTKDGGDLYDFVETTDK